MKPDIYLSGFCHLSPVYSCFGDTSVSSSLCASVHFRVRSGRARSRLHKVLCCIFFGSGLSQTGFGSVLGLNVFSLVMSTQG